MDTTAIGRTIAQESRGGLDTLGQFDRAIVGAKNVRLNLPLRDPVEVKRHLSMIEDTVHRLRLLLEERKPDRSLLFMVRGELRQLNQKLNAYRRVSGD